MTAERIPQMEFITSVATSAAFIFRAPPLSYVSNIYYLPFAGIVWGCVILLVIIGATIVYSTFALPKCNKNYYTTAVSEVVLLAAGTVSQMGTHLPPKMLSGKISTVSGDQLNPYLHPNIHYILAVFFSDWNSIHLHVICSQYCCPIAVDNNFNQNSGGSPAFRIEIWRSRYTLQPTFLPQHENTDASCYISNKNRSTK